MLTSNAYYSHYDLRTRCAPFSIFVQFNSLTASHFRSLDGRSNAMYVLFHMVGELVQLIVVGFELRLDGTRNT